MNSISMLEGMASGLPVLQRFDEMNAGQIEAGVNGYLFHTAQEMSGRLRDFKALSPENRAAFEERVIGSVISRGASELAEYMLGVYKKALSEKPDIGVKRRLRL